MPRLAHNQSLPVDIGAREVFGKAAIAVALRDHEAAIEVCKLLLDVEREYCLTLRTAPLAPEGDADPTASRRGLLMLAKFAGRCATCSGRIAPGESIFYDRAAKAAHHERCAP